MEDGTGTQTLGNVCVGGDGDVEVYNSVTRPVADEGCRRDSPRNQHPGTKREGRIHVTALSMLQTYLKDSSHADLLLEACDESKAEVELLIRSRFPRTDVADSIRPVPVQAQLGSDAAAAGQPVGAAASPSVALDSTAEAIALAAMDQSSAGVSPRATVELHARPRVSPLSAHRFHIQFTAGIALKDELERALDLMSHSNPKRDLATVIERGLDLLLADLEKKKLGKTDRPRRSPGTKRGDFSRWARREIYERDGEQCTYTSPSGERCQARAFVQLDHYDPRARGGAGTARNGRLLCGAHNLFEAEKVFGRKYIEDRIRLRQRESSSESPRVPEQSFDDGAHVEGAVERDSMGGAIRLRRQTSSNESGRTQPQTRVEGDAESPTAIDAPNSRPRDADEPTPPERLSYQQPHAHEPASPNPPCSRPTDAGPLTSPNASRCCMEESCGPRCSESLRCLEHVAGGAADPQSEVVPSGQVRDQACVDAAEVESRLLSALTNMGFRRGDSKRAIAALAQHGDSRSQGGELLVALLRQALAILVP